jgi:hypothetical protein
VSFNDNNEEVEFLKAQLPSEDDLLDGLGADTAPAYDQAGGDAGGGGDAWGYYDDKGASRGVFHFEGEKNVVLVVFVSLDSPRRLLAPPISFFLT